MPTKYTDPALKKPKSDYKKVSELREIYSNFDRQIRRLNMAYSERLETVTCTADILRLNRAYERAEGKLRKLLRDDVVAALNRF